MSPSDQMGSFLEPQPLPGRGAGGALLVVAALWGAVAGCRGESPEESRAALYRSSVELKQDSAATVAFFTTVLGDSVQRERLARVILENEGMRRTMSRVLLADSLASVPGAGIPDWRPPPTPSDAAAYDAERRPGASASPDPVADAERRSDVPLRAEPAGEPPAAR